MGQRWTADHEEALRRQAQVLPGPGEAGRVFSWLLGSTLTLQPQGRLDCTLHREFRACYEQAPMGTTDYVLDLSATLDLDSSALGMLLLLRDHAGGVSGRVHLVNATPALLEKLRRVHFDMLFDIVGGSPGAQAGGSPPLTGLPPG